MSGMLKRRLLRKSLRSNRMRNGKYELVVAPEGYPGKKYRGKYCYEHILNYWKNTNKLPESGYEIHHLDGNHRNNKIENLLLVTSKEHRKIHGKLLKKAPIEKECSNCLISISVSFKHYKNKIKRGQVNFFCSHRCVGFFTAKRLKNKK
ncbi:MAG: HNH endonuclease [Proteobacteria bacterium]|nr:HNH endonuclease [Pseudomonadota bacterium]